LDTAPSEVDPDAGTGTDPALGEVRVDRLRPDRIDAYYRLLRSHGGKGGRPLAPATIRRIHGILRLALQ
jgi:hypothetical protein